MQTQETYTQAVSMCSRCRFEDIGHPQGECPRCGNGFRPVRTVEVAIGKHLVVTREGVRAVDDDPTD